MPVEILLKTKFCLEEKKRDRGKRTAALVPVSQRAFRGQRAKAEAEAEAVERAEGNRGLIAYAVVLPLAEQPTKEEAATLKAETLAAGH